jgi:hypothetical protein
MLILTISDLGVEKARLNQSQEKPLVCVFDPIAAHALILDFALAGLRDKINIFWQSSFSQFWIENGGINEKINGALIAEKRPVIFISELEVIPPGYTFGIKMLQNIRQTNGFGNLPLIVISSYDRLSQAWEKAAKKLKELRISQFFDWKDLETEPKERERLFNFVSQIIASRNESQK